MGREAQSPHSRLTPRLEADLHRMNFIVSVSCWRNVIRAGH